MKINITKKLTKKLTALTVACCSILSSASVFAAAQNIIIDDNYVTIPEDMGTIREMDDRTFVPVRFLSEYMGCNVNFDSTLHTSETKEWIEESVNITNLNTGVSYFMVVGKNMLFVLSETHPYCITMDTNVFVGDDDRAYIPIRFFAQAMDYDVDWDAETETVILKSKQSNN